MSITTDLPTDESNISVEKLSILLANTYTLYLKTQNYHLHYKSICLNNVNLIEIDI